MFFKQIKSIFQDAISYVVSHLNPYLDSPDRDFTRRRKLPPDMLISFLVSQGASGTGNELTDFFDFHCGSPSLSALNQQRDKLKPEAIEEVFHQLNGSLSKLTSPSGFRLLAVDGPSFSFSSSPRWACEDYLVSQGHSAKGFYSVHLNAVYDLNTHTYADRSSSPYILKMNLRLSASWWTVWSRRMPAPVSLSLTAATALTIIWLMSWKKSSFSYSVPKMSMSGAWLDTCLFPKKEPLTYSLILPSSVPTQKKSAHPVIMLPLLTRQLPLILFHMDLWIPIQFLSGS